jgi:hypothetical protein
MTRTPPINQHLFQSDAAALKPKAAGARPKRLGSNFDNFGCPAVWIITGDDYATSLPPTRIPT